MVRWSRGHRARFAKTIKARKRRKNFEKIRKAALAQPPAQNPLPPPEPPLPEAFKFNNGGIYFVDGDRLRHMSLQTVRLFVADDYDWVSP